MSGRAALLRNLKRGRNRGRLRIGAEGWQLRKHLFGDDLKIGLLLHNLLPGDAFQFEVGRAGRSCGGSAKGLAQVDGQVLRRRDVCAVFGHGRERIDVIHLLVGVALLVDQKLAACQSNDGRAAQIGILQTGGQIDRADGLRHTQAGGALDPCIGIGHIGGGLFTVGLHSLDPQFFHLH